jgi:hypothetical protein
MIKRPWVPPQNDDELHRQLDLFIWGDALIHAQEAAQAKFVRMIRNGNFEIPSLTDLTNAGIPFMEAVRQLLGPGETSHLEAGWWGVPSLR